VLAQDALGGAVNVLVMTCRVLTQPLERLRAKVYLSGHRRHRTSEFTAASQLPPGERGGADGDNGARI
jgi:hypothetical protein